MLEIVGDLFLRSPCLSLLFLGGVVGVSLGRVPALGGVWS